MLSAGEIRTNGRYLMDELTENRRDVWSERELLRLIDSLSTSGHITDELAEKARTILQEEGFQPAIQTLRTGGAFE